MKARVVTNKEIKIAREVAKSFIYAEADAITMRTNYMWMAAMINAGLSIKTIKKTAKEVGEVAKEFDRYKHDRVADFELVRGLREHGLDVPDLPTEIEM